MKRKIVTSSKAARFGISLLAIIVLLVSSSSAACLCSHHQTKTETHSCHQTSPEDQTIQVSDSNAAEVSKKIEAFCDCLKKAPPIVLNKSENNKTQKDAALSFKAIEAEISLVVSQQVTANFEYAYHFYNSNYLKKLTPPRAPPVL